MKKILVTGGAGYIGSHTVVELVAAGYEAIIVDDLSNSSVQVLARLKSITGREISFYQGSVADKEFMNRVFEENHIDAVIHFAAYKAVGESVQEPLKYYENNVGGTIALLEVMKENKVDHIIFSSSATVYGMNNISPLTEDLSTSAINPYGYTKLMMEQILTDVALANSDWSVTNLRYFNPIGAHESGMIGEAPKGIPNNLMPYITQVAVGKLQELSIFGNDYDTHDGTGVRDYIHVVDLAKGHVLALKHNLENKGVAVFNLGTGIGYSVLDMVKVFENVNGVKIPYTVKDRRPGDVATCYADASKANDILGWKAEKTLQDMMRDSWRWQSSNPNGYEG
ncbi:UDP-glucose 4-epimerase GalE [Streptococcus sanguinis]|jgi:UDP-glucose 4-epimerase|uniref:UDP-glucose 4-epimerase n=1 Tax=Streptococcus sanguinis TaxID=1305 RepID=A0A2X3VCV9_STRSA|nr:UDP-glucose 4-epimerase GalE [Streptococcus sanguinis]EGJ43034.1 UDP-glucose 4-epimerase [Streptococcus sanguinis SK1059]EGQ18999.1 UDP-glucose 4-epimerase [Streptococcus sanguinis ATCC 29667]EGQ23021.1 UDP-glucose 4-epimerase [Streptococcus sanguinis SK340]SQF33689.1 UDP-glucose 4-epimerase [Streptococcus sanguinis]